MGDVEQQTFERTVHRARESDPDAWEVLYRRMHPRMHAYARRRLSPPHCDDAVSETFARAIAAVARFDGRPGGFDGWLFGILRNVILEQYRAPRSSADRDATSELPSPEAGPLDQLVAGESASTMRQAFDRLDADDRELLELRVLGGLDADAVGAIVGKRAGAVRMAQSRALARLADLLYDAEPAR
jgi:RNA polymerase sigma-70 factor, ECF subfamily